MLFMSGFVLEPQNLWKLYQIVFSVSVSASFFLSVCFYAVSIFGEKLPRWYLNELATKVSLQNSSSKQVFLWAASSLFNFFLLWDKTASAHRDELLKDAEADDWNTYNIL